MLYSQGWQNQNIEILGASRPIRHLHSSDNTEEQNEVRGWGADLKHNIIELKLQPHQSDNS